MSKQLTQKKIQHVDWSVNYMESKFAWSFAGSKGQEEWKKDYIAGWELVHPAPPSPTITTCKSQRTLFLLLFLSISIRKGKLPRDVKERKKSYFSPFSDLRGYLSLQSGSTVEINIWNIKTALKDLSCSVIFPLPCCEYSKCLTLLNHLVAYNAKDRPTVTSKLF